MYFFTRIAVVSISAILLSSPSNPQTVFKDAGAAQSDIADTVNAFREALGPENGGAPANGDPDGLREIDWDDIPNTVADPNPIPGDFFNSNENPTALGIEFEATGTTDSFFVSANPNTGIETSFGFPTNLVPFSDFRMFTPGNGNTFDINFFNPADQTELALSAGIGFVFLDVEFVDQTQVTLFNREGKEIFSDFAEVTESAGFSFLGALFETPQISSASITLGSAFFTANNVAFTSLIEPVGDAVVVDNVIFGEPIPISAVPLPGGFWMLLAGLAIGVNLRKRAL
ncbi:MAG: VPLPA-CTERM sorting domain-containing protein [Pseudomonadota bacterium]